ncbi:hybrid sensor histidine kinase/response regulator transcription factor [Polaribacter glomeratus]|uniref:histidine kinase n=1 Tax=Polaribacter glomeratus TaxID=102 RepID=A0A2S7WWK3_9FLAO|nr:ATP-binding protein [Polaribacter glomeratus]PQJ81937.1 hypothetical protein BTO16_04830 [Polaribacter glomeratus]TXD64426.1 response regulator [Polaribacter glomeratus]
MKYLLLLLFSLHFSAHSQSSKNANQVATVLEFSSKLIKEIKTLPIDTIQKRSLYLLSLINNNNKIDTISSIQHARLKASLNVMALYATKDKLDSVKYYRNSIIKNIFKDSLKLNFDYNKILAFSEFYYAGIEEKKLNYSAALEAYYTAFNLFKRTKDKQKTLTCLIELINLHLVTKNISLAYSTFDTLNEIFNEYQLNPLIELDPLLGNHILLVHGKILYEDKKYKQSLEVLKNINKKLYKLNSPYLFAYNNAISYTYLGNHKIDSALIFAKKNSNVAELPLEYLFSKNKLFSQIYIAKKEYKTAEKYIDTTLKVLKGSNMSSHSYIYDIMSKIEENKGNYKKAFQYYTQYKVIEDSINSLELERKGILINYSIRKELVHFKESTKIRETLFKKNTDILLLVMVLIVVVILSAFTIISIHKKEKRRKLKLELEFVKKTAKERKKFLENLSHEIRTPISIIIGYLNLIKNNSMNTDKIVSYSEKTIDTSEHMIDSLNNFLTLSKLNVVELKAKKTLKPFRNFVEELVFSFEACANLKNQGLYYKSNIKTEVSIDFEYEYLNKIICNLIMNAIKYTNTEKTIYVTSNIEEKYYILTVIDEGVGISINELDTIFNRFQQTEKNSENGGFGIGLSLVHELVTVLNGIVSVKSEPDIGSIFTVQIPLEIPHQSLYVCTVAQEYQCVHAVRMHPKVSVKNNLPKALIVDDNIEMISYYKDLLDTKLNCTFAFNGVKGLEIAKQQQFDIVISDYKMPQMNGFEFKAALNKLENYKNIPFIMITATPLIIYETIELSIGIDDCITKPFKNEELLARVHNLLENTIYKNKVKNIDKDIVDFSGSFSVLMEKINRIIILNIANEAFSVKNLAKECAFSQQHLSLILKKNTGLTPGKLILEIRLLKAYEYILNQTYQTLNEVIYAVGLNSRTYFNKVFLKRFGIKPNDLLKKTN